MFSSSTRQAGVLGYPWHFESGCLEPLWCSGASAGLLCLQPTWSWFTWPHPHFPAGFPGATQAEENQTWLLVGPWVFSGAHRLEPAGFLIPGPGLPRAIFDLRAVQEVPGWWEEAGCVNGRVEPTEQNKERNKAEVRLLHDKALKLPNGHEGAHTFRLHRDVIQPKISHNVPEVMSCLLSQKWCLWKDFQHWKWQQTHCLSWDALRSTCLWQLVILVLMFPPGLCLANVSFGLSALQNRLMGVSECCF